MPILKQRYNPAILPDLCNFSSTKKILVKNLRIKSDAFAKKPQGRWLSKKRQLQGAIVKQ
jgi:hypothetical protein